MKSVPLHLWKALKDGEDISAKIEPRFPEAVAWVSVAAFKKDRAHLAPDRSPGVPWKYRVRYFEVPQWMMDQHLDIGPGQFLHNEQHVVDSLEEVDDLLDRFVGDPSKFKLMSDWPDYVPY
jgi:hypothetical protein